MSSRTVTRTAGRSAAARPPKGAERTQPAASADSLPPAGSCTCSSLRALTRRITAHYDAAFAPLGITVGQYALLSTLARAAAAGEPPPGISVLAERVATDRTTTTRAVDALAAADLVRIDADPGDARSRRVALTTAGEALRRRALPSWITAQQQLDALLGAPLHEALRDQVRRARHALREPGASRSSSVAAALASSPASTPVPAAASSPASAAAPSAATRSAPRRARAQVDRR
jgi:DNA-binding MarR family transcriptional regulator